MHEGECIRGMRTLFKAIVEHKYPCSPLFTPPNASLNIKVQGWISTAPLGWETECVSKTTMFIFSREHYTTRFS
jgi:hypothetical protein